MPRKPRPALKQCPRCPPGTPPKPTSEFPKNKSLADGLAAYCRQCKRQAERDRRHPKAPEAPKSKAVSDEPAKNLTPKLRKGGQRSSISDELTVEICRALRMGFTRRVGARCAGIDEDKLAQWMHRGREADPGEPTRVFYEAVLEAEGHGVQRLEQLVLDGAEVDPHMAMKVLERRSPDDWARRERIDVSTTEKPMETDDLRKLLTEQIGKLITQKASPPPSADGPIIGSAGGVDQRPS